MRSTGLILLACLGSLGFCAPFPFDGFGRFGRFHNDGLLTLNVHPNGFQTVGGTETLEASWTAKGAPTVASIDGTQKTLRWPATTEGIQEIQYSLLYPGFSIRTNGTLSVKLKAQSGVRSRMVRFGEHRGVILASASGEAPPVLMSLDPSVISVKVDDQELTIRSKAPGGALRWISINGILSADLTSPHLDQLAKEWLGIPVPKLVGATFQNGVETTMFTGRIAPVSPLLGRLGLAPDAQKGPRTRLGSYLYYKGSTAKTRLPDLRTEARGYVIPTNAPADLVQLSTDLVGDVQNSWANNAVDLAYSRRVPSLLAYGAIDQKKREEAIQCLKRDLARAFEVTKPVWNQETEPFTGVTYAYTYSIKGPGLGKYDIEWGNLLPVYGLYAYLLATGDMSLVEQCWPGLKQALTYVEKAQDWAWCTNVNADHGFSTGTGDPVNAAFAGLVAAVQIAEQLGHMQEARRWRWIAQRTAVTANARLSMTPFAELHGLIAPNRIALGFHETENFTRSPLDGDPWYPVSLFSGNGVMPELFNQYTQDNPAGLTETLARLERAYPEWWDGNHSYPFKGTYSGNSVYVTYPHIFARLRTPAHLPEITTEKLHRAASNRVHSWVAPNVIAEFLAKDSPIVFTQWRGAGLVQAHWDGSGSVTAELSSGRTGPVVLRWQLKPGWTAKSARSGDQKVLIKNQEARLHLNPGTHKIHLQLERS